MTPRKALDICHQVHSSSLHAFTTVPAALHAAYGGTSDNPPPTRLFTPVHVALGAVGCEQRLVLPRAGRHDDSSRHSGDLPGDVLP